MSFLIEWCFRGDYKSLRSEIDTPKQLKTLHVVSHPQNGQNLPLEIKEPDQPKSLLPYNVKIKLINGQIPAQLPHPNSAEWDPTKMLQQAQYDAFKQQSNKIDPNYAFYKNSAKSYKVCFEEKYNHGLYKIAKNYYIITKSKKVHRLTIETFLNDGCPQRMYLNSKVILNNRGPRMDIVWDGKFCTPQLLQRNGNVVWIEIKIPIEDRVYTLRNKHPKYERKSKVSDDTDTSYYFVDRPIKSFVLRNIAGFWVKNACACKGSDSDPNSPHFTLNTPPFENSNDTNTDKQWKFEIDTRSIVHKGKVWFGLLNFIMVLFDIIMWFPCGIFSGIMVYVWLFKMCCTGGFGQKPQIPVQHEPECVTFDENEAVQYFQEIQSRNKLQK